jgi:hypothetical protein|tara:strand:- start:142906 stop:143511 length:606 start_codon:yes stop_codon:yes gene_type:complete
MAKRASIFSSSSGEIRNLLTVKEGSSLAVQSFYMIALKNHIKLSGMADKKANLILAVCALLISGILTNSIRFIGISGNEYLILPTVIFVVFLLIAMILSIITTIPKITSGTFNKEAVKNHEVNLAFFGNFHKMKLEEYEWAVNQMRTSTDQIYEVLTKDLYFLGCVLNKKFKLLNTTYTVLAIGIISSITCYIWVIYKHSR